MRVTVLKESSSAGLLLEQDEEANVFHKVKVQGVIVSEASGWVLRSDVVSRRRLSAGARRAARAGQGAGGAAPSNPARCAPTPLPNRQNTTFFVNFGENATLNTGTVAPV